MVDKVLTISNDGVFLKTFINKHDKVVILISETEFFEDFKIIELEDEVDLSCLIKELKTLKKQLYGI
jgi:hypothetical protein